MQMEIIPMAKQHTITWSGGTTTELFIYPQNGNYIERNFVFRISTAVCKEENTVFTRLENTRRILMVLSGEVTLEHIENNKNRIVHLLPGDQDSFAGDDVTKSRGICTDFNLMMKDNAEGTLMYYTFQWQEEMKYICDSDYIGIYVVSGTLRIQVENRINYLEQKTFCMMTHIKKNEKVMLDAQGECVFIICEID